MKEGQDMFEVLIKSLTYILIITIGFTLKKKKIFKKEDANVIATIIMNITLPCALLTSANGIEMSFMILVLILIGIVSNLIMIFISYLTTAKENRTLRAVFMLNASSYNIGNFSLPFVQAFFPSMGVVYLCSFDIGNALMALGITYALADHVASGENHFDIKELLKKLFSSIPFDVYMIIFILAIFKLQVPDPILNIASTIGAGNSFLAMLIIGMMLELKVSPLETKNIIKVIVLRLSGTITLSLITYFLLPFPLLVKQILIMAFFAPIGTVVPVFTKKIGYEGDLSPTANSLSIIISVISMIILLLLFI